MVKGALVTAFFVAACFWAGWVVATQSLESVAISAGAGLAGAYTTHRWRSSAMFKTYRTYRKCGHSRFGALRIAARHHLGKP